MLSRVAMVATVLAACDPGAPAQPDGREDAEQADMMIMPDASPCAAIDIAAGGEHTCAITATGDLYCWGRADEGQIGITALASRCVGNTIYCEKKPVQVANLPSTIAVGLGGQHTCSSSGGQTYCWGKNTSGQFGNGNVIGAVVPLAIAQRPMARAIDGGTAHTCSLSDDKLWCSGSNTEGQVGNMSGGTQDSAVQVMTNVVSFNLGGTTSCAIDASKDLYCWGRNLYKTIDQTGQIKTFPARVAGIADVEQVAVGADHICALLGGGTAECWGLNASGQIGNGQTNGNTAIPMTVVSGNAVEIVASRNHTCVRTTTNDVYCFGEGYTPAPMFVIAGAAKITAGASHDCAVMRDGSIRCWGDQTYAQLGNNLDLASRQLTPQLARLCP